MQKETLSFKDQMFEPRKQCTICGRFKLLSQFYNWSRGRKSPYFKACENKETRRQSEWGEMRP